MYCGTYQQVASCSVSCCHQSAFCASRSKSGTCLSYSNVFYGAAVKYHYSYVFSGCYYSKKTYYAPTRYYDTVKLNIKLNDGTSHPFPSVATTSTCTKIVSTIPIDTCNFELKGLRAAAVAAPPWSGHGLLENLWYYLQSSVP
jgi:hypothetical protein